MLKDAFQKKVKSWLYYRYQNEHVKGFVLLINQQRNHADVVTSSKDNGKPDTFLDQEYRNKYVNGVRLIFAQSKREGS